MSRAGHHLLSRDIVASATSGTIYALALGIASVALPLLALRAGYSAAEVGALTATSAISQLATRLVLGAVMRRWPDWTLIAGAALLLGVGNGIAALSASLVPFVIAQLLQGVSRACFWTGSQTHVVRGPSRAASALAAVNLSSSVGLLAGPGGCRPALRTHPGSSASRSCSDRRPRRAARRSCWTDCRRSCSPTTGRRGGSGDVRGSASGAGPA